MTYDQQWQSVRIVREASQGNTQLSRCLDRRGTLTDIMQDVVMGVVIELLDKPATRTTRPERNLAHLTQVRVNVGLVSTALPYRARPPTGAYGDQSEDWWAETPVPARFSKFGPHPSARAF